MESRNVLEAAPDYVRQTLLSRLDRIERDIRVAYADRTAALESMTQSDHYLAELNEERNALRKALQSD